MNKLIYQGFHGGINDGVQNNFIYRYILKELKLDYVATIQHTMSEYASMNVYTYIIYGYITKLLRDAVMFQCN